MFIFLLSKQTVYTSLVNLIVLLSLVKCLYRTWIHLSTLQHQFRIHVDHTAKQTLKLLGFILYNTSYHLPLTVLLMCIVPSTVEIGFRLCPNSIFCSLLILECHNTNWKNLVRFVAFPLICSLLHALHHVMSLRNVFSKGLVVVTYST